MSELIDVENRSSFANLIVLSVFTGLAVWSGSNILLQNSDILFISFRVLLVCIALFLTVYLLLRHFGSLQAAVASVFILLVINVYFPSLGVKYIFLVCSLVGIYLLMSDIKRYNISVIYSAVISFFSAIVILSFLSYERFDMLSLLSNGQIHRDSLFHASLASMIKTYGVASTGLNGLVEVPYHILSHVIMGSISSLTGIAVYDSYGIVNAVFFAPLLFLAISFSSWQVKQEKNIGLHWVMTGVILFLMPTALAGWGVFSSYFISESYLLSLVFFVLSLPLLCSKRISKSQYLVLVIMITLATASKSSVGLVMLGLYLTRMLLISDKIDKYLEYAYLSALIVIIYYFISSTVSSASSAILIDPFSFIAEFSHYGSYLNVLKSCGSLSECDFSFMIMVKALISVIVFFVLHFILSWMVIMLKTHEYGFRIAIRDPWVIISISSLAAGVVIISFFYLQSGAVYYFSNIAMFASMPIIISFFSALFGGSIKQYFWLAFISAVTAIFSHNYSHLLKLIDGKYSEKEFPVSESNHSFIRLLLDLRNEKEKNIIYAFSEGYNYLEHGTMTDCRVKPFVLPAITERAWLNLMEQNGDCNYSHYGFGNYASGVDSNGNIEYTKVIIPDNVEIVIVENP